MLHYLVAACYGDTFKIMNNCLQTFILTLFEIVNIPLLKVFFVKDLDFLPHFFRDYLRMYLLLYSVLKSLISREIL